MSGIRNKNYRLKWSVEILARDAYRLVERGNAGKKNIKKPLTATIKFLPP